MKSAFRPADKPLVQRGSNAGPMRVFVPPPVYMGFRLFVLLGGCSRHVRTMLWKVRGTVVSWANGSVGVPSCPAPPRRPAKRRPDPTRPWYVRVLDSTGAVYIGFHLFVLSNIPPGLLFTMFWKSKDNGHAGVRLRPTSVSPRLASLRPALPRRAPSRSCDVRVLDSTMYFIYVLHIRGDVQDGCLRKLFADMPCTKRVYRDSGATVQPGTNSGRGPVYEPDVNRSSTGYRVPPYGIYRISFVRAFGGTSSKVFVCALEGKISGCRQGAPSRRCLTRPAPLRPAPPRPGPPRPLRRRAPPCPAPSVVCPGFGPDRWGQQERSCGRGLSKFETRRISCWLLDWSSRWTHRFLH